MKNLFNRQSQFELFPGSPGVQPQKRSSFISGRSFTLSIENVILIVVIFSMTLLVSFSFGVEKGKRIVRSAAMSTGRQEILQKTQRVERKGEAEVSEIEKRGDEARIDGQQEDEKGQILAQKLENQPRLEKKVDKTPTLEKIHTIQVASFKQKSRAEIESKTLEKRGYDAFVAKKGSYFIVCVGRFGESLEGQPLLRALKKTYSDCYIRSL